MRRNSKILLALLVCLFIYYPKRKEIVIAPKWTDIKYLANSSYLNILENNTRLDPDAKPLIILPKSKYDELKHNYREMNRNYQMRVDYGLVNNYEREEHYKKINSFSSLVMRTVINYQVKEQIKKQKKNNPMVRTFQKVEAAVASVRQGTEIKTKNGTKIGGKVDFIGQHTAVWLTSPIVNGRFYLYFGDGGERYTFDVSRSVGAFSISTNYAGTSEIVSTSLSRPILPGLSASVSSNYEMKVGRFNQVASINYGLTF